MRVALLALALAGCATVTPRGPLGGRWGGEQVELAFDEGGKGRITLSCAWATIDEPVMPGVGGHFLAKGSFTQGSGAPPPVPPTPVPANVSGRLDPDGTLWLSVATHEGMKVDNARLWKGREPNLYFCP